MFFQNAVVSKILYCTKIYTNPVNALPNDGRHSHALVFFLEGNSDYVYGDKTYSAKPGSLLFLPEGEKYVIKRYSTAQCIYVDFSISGDVAISPFVKNYPNTSQFRDIFLSLLSVYKQKRVGYEAEMMSLLYKLISMIQIADMAAYFPDVKYQKIAPSVDYINKNYCSGDVKISKLAEISGVSVRYFNELFSAFFGVSPKEYIIRMQLETARNLLLSTSDSISDIADACGFLDVYYFSKIFKKEVGETPSAFRKVNKNL